MYKNKIILQIGSHEGNTDNDPIFNEVDEQSQLILVEPVPELFEKLKSNYTRKFQHVKDYRQENLVFINKAVSTFIGKIEMTIPSQRNNFAVLPSWASQLASINPGHAWGHIRGILTDRISVETTTVNQIIQECGISKLDLLHTDTEGHDFPILMHYDYAIKPKCILFEHKHMDGLLTVGKNYVLLSNKLFSMGYHKIYQNTEDSLFEIDDMLL